MGLHIYIRCKLIGWRNQMVEYIQDYILQEIMDRLRSQVSMSIEHVQCYLLHISCIFHMVKVCKDLLVVWVWYKLDMGCHCNHVCRYILHDLQLQNNQHFFRKGQAYKVEVLVVVTCIHLEEVDLVNILSCIHKEVEWPHIEQNTPYFHHKDLVRIQLSQLE